MKILIVTDPEAIGSIHIYSAECTDEMIMDVETAFEELDIHTEPDIVDDIAIELEHGRNYWFNEKLCFDTIEI